MLYAAIKALLSGVIIAAASEVAKRNPAIGAVILSLPLISILAFIWLWRDTGDSGADRLAGAIHLLVRVADAADVPGAARAAAQRHGLLAGARARLPDNAGALCRDGVDARPARHFALSRLWQVRGRHAGLRLGVVLLRQRHVGAPILAAPAPGPRIAFADQNAGGVLAFDEKMHQPPPVFVAP